MVTKNCLQELGSV